MDPTQQALKNLRKKTQKSQTAFEKSINKINSSHTNTNTFVNNKNVINKQKKLNTDKITSSFYLNNQNNNSAKLK